MSLVVRSVEPSEFETLTRVAMHTFGGEPVDEEARGRWSRNLDVKRTYAAFDDGAMVGTAGAFSLELTIPGGSIPMAGLTLVSVRPTHRRQGVLRAMMAKHEEDLVARGEAVSGLWASDPGIYPRFGYGLAAESHVLETDLSRVHFVESRGRDEIRIIELDEAEARLSPLFAEFARSRPGTYARTTDWWQGRTLHDGKEGRAGASSLRIAVARRDGRDVGYVLYRQEFAADRAIMAGTAKIIELIALDRDAEQSLWYFMTHLDLYPHLRWWNAPLDSALPWLVDNRRQLHRTRTDTLWIYIRDVAAALEARGYSDDGRLRLGLEGEEAMAAAGTWELVVAQGRASCQPSPGQWDIRLSRQDLSSLYLGAFRVAELAALGRIEGSADAIALADRMFASSPAPWCQEVF